MSELVTSVASASKHGFVRYDGVHQVADRLRVGTAVLHCPSERFPITEPVRCTMTPEGCRAVPLDSPADRLPIHYAEFSVRLGVVVRFADHVTGGGGGGGGGLALTLSVAER